MKRLKRFYDKVSVKCVEKDLYHLLLDSRTVRTPLGGTLSFKSEGIASAVGSEWEIQGEFVIPNSMPMNSIMMTFLDVDSKLGRGEKEKQISRFLQTDTLRFPAEKSDSALARAQGKYWEKPKTFLRETMKLELTRGNAFSVPSSTDAEIAEIRERILSKYDGLDLTLLETGAKFLKSGSLAIALIEGAVTAEEAWQAAYAEELSQRENWGLVEGEHDYHDAETLLWLNGVGLLASLKKC